jgi:hypothetical protein
VNRFLELPGQVAVGKDAVALASIKRVLSTPATQDHLRVTDEVAIDQNLDAIDLHRSSPMPFRLDVACPLAGSTFAQEHDVGA